jgi:hypothetical protein
MAPCGEQCSDADPVPFGQIPISGRWKRERRWPSEELDRRITPIERQIARLTNP